MTDRFKVVTDDGVTLSAGPTSKDRPPAGFTQEQAERIEADANAKAVRLGLETRYDIVPLDPEAA